MNSVFDNFIENQNAGIFICKKILVCRLRLRELDQVTKGTWRMPWHKKAMKDVVSCDKPRVGANNP